jgi:predicted amidohydrolase
MAQAAEPVGPEPGPSLRWAEEIARELDLDLVAGSVVEHRPDRDRSANTSVHFGPDGAVRAVYRKLHMFDVEVEGVRYAESEHEEPGSDVVVSALADGTPLGMSICYDVRFPELYRELSERHARVLTVPSAFTLATTRDHWEVLLRARAIENQCFVVAANQIGENAPGRRSGGRSMIVDPWGVVLATAPDAEGVIVADLDLSRLEDIRRRLPALEHRRPHDVYAGDRVRA